MMVLRGKKWLHRKVMIAGILALLLMGSIVGCSASRDAKSSGSATSADTAAAPAAADMKNQSSTESLKLKSVDQNASAANTAASSKMAAPAASSAPITVTPAIGNDGSEGFNRKLIYKANLVMPVKDYSAAQTQLRDLVALSGAYILQFSESTNSGEKGGSFTIKVAANGFVPLLDGLEKISPSYQRNVQGQDVTEEYVDLSSRLKAKQVVETRLLAFMDKATKTDELLAFSNELAKVQGEIEQIKGRMRYLDQNVSYSTVELRMYQQTGSKPPFDPNKGIALSDRLQNAWIASLNVLTVVLQGILVFMAAAFPILLLAAIVLIPAYYYKRRRNQRLADTRNQLKQQNKSESSTLNEPTDTI
ncbi:DUF4349 domain-containing protein [Paenibacillus sp. GP183]|uniref:DUF4349 domain-containing protein n=1 Tax=Paenibacillus sp. GP183 TaxID=1882751 RepID=UPI00089B1480|nr:DUF4349 domain-containing protein [Paenibacillus sp. GP183]SEB41718.1 protein of unknown function [Paenibacillus sp. GP183]